MALQPRQPVPGDGCVGIVIPLPAPLDAELVRLRASFEDPLAAVVPPHITLVTGAETSDWAAAAGHARAVAASGAPFTVRLQGTGTFRPVSPVVYLNVAAGRAECVALHEALQAGPLSEPEFEFHPHVTLAHGVAEASMDRAMATLAGFSAEFLVDRIGLFQCGPGGLWVLREELRLGGADPA